MKSVNNLALLILKRARHKIIFKWKKLKIQQFGRLSEAYLTLPRAGIKKLIFWKKWIFWENLKDTLLLAGRLEFCTSLIDEDVLKSWRTRDTQVRVLRSQNMQSDR